MSDLKAMYKKMKEEDFPRKMEISFENSDGSRQTMHYQKKEWTIDGEKKGLRYGENPCQPAALYLPVNGNLAIGDVQTIQPGKYLASDAELLKSGKHPGKTNLTDADNSLNILRYFSDKPCCVIVKHNNPCGVALGSSINNAYNKAFLADRVASYGGAVSVNREIDKATAEQLRDNYTEVVVAPSFAPGVMDIFNQKKYIRVMEIREIEKLNDYIGSRYIDYKSLIDGSIIAQLSYSPKTLSENDFLPAECEKKGDKYKINRLPDKRELKDMLFGWLVESGITSNSVIYVKNGVTVGIGTGEQDRVGVAEIARDKAYKKMYDRLAWEIKQCPWHTLDDEDIRLEIIEKTKKVNAGLKESVMVSDAFFPFRDGADVGLKEGVSAIVQPGGALRDNEVISACNEYDAAMVFTGQRSFKH